jgi:hypothetical protein
MKLQPRFEAVESHDIRLPEELAARYARITEEYDHYIASLTPADAEKGKEWNELTEEEQAFILRQTG